MDNYEISIDKNVSNLEMTVTADKTGLDSLDRSAGAQLMNNVSGSGESLLDAALFLPDNKKDWLTILQFLSRFQ